MATSVYTVEEIELQNGVTISLKPLTIKALRKFMEKMKEFAEAETEDESVRKLVEASALCFAKQQPELAADIDELEDVLDMPTIYKIIEVCGGIKLNDPKLMEIAEQTALANLQG